MLLDRFWCKIGLCGIGGSSSNTGAELAGGDDTTAHILTTAPNFDLPLMTPTPSLEFSTSLSAAAVVTAAHMDVGESGKPQETGFIAVIRTQRFLRGLEVCFYGKSRPEQHC